MTSATDSLPNRVMILPVAQQIQALLSTAHQNSMLPLVLLSKKDEPPPMLKSIALAFEKTVIVGLMPNPDKATMAQYGAKKLPHLVTMFAAPNKDGSEVKPGEQQQFQVAGNLSQSLLQLLVQLRNFQV